MQKIKHSEALSNHEILARLMQAYNFYSGSSKEGVKNRHRGLELIAKIVDVSMGIVEQMLDGELADFNVLAQECKKSGLRLEKYRLQAYVTRIQTYIKCRYVRFT